MSDINEDDAEDIINDALVDEANNLLEEIRTRLLETWTPEQARFVLSRLASNINEEMEETP